MNACVFSSREKESSFCKLHTELLAASVQVYTINVKCTIFAKTFFFARMHVNISSLYQRAFLLFGSFLYPSKIYKYLMNSSVVFFCLSFDLNFCFPIFPTASRKDHALSGSRAAENVKVPG